MNKQIRKYGSILILILITNIFLIGCMVTINNNMGHHINTKKEVADVEVGQEYDLKAEGNRR